VANEQLWAPWRLGYIKGDTAKGDEQKSPQAERPKSYLSGAEPGCFICRGVAEGAASKRGDDGSDHENLIVHRGATCCVVLNRYPYNNGHLLVAPLRHVGRLEQLSTEEQLESQQLLARFVVMIEKLMNAEGFNIGLNLGRVAGAGLPGHLHWHIVPRWNGDTNFMSVLGAIDVIPQSLDALWHLLREAQQAETPTG
jgi:ATP adenylyltransferase